jgi:hypothetical protein
MGINRLDLELILRLRRDGYIRDNARVIELGAQQLARVAIESKDILRELGERFGTKGELCLPTSEAAPVYEWSEEKLDPAAPRARAMWVWLGFSYAAIDIDGSPESIPLDLNFDDVPKSQKNAYDLVTNYGTTEHVANQMNAFKIAHDLAAEGGVMIHHLPCQGNLNHGLINYSPKFFWKLARSNDYRWLHFNYLVSGESYPVPTNLIDSIREFSPDIDERMNGRPAPTWCRFSILGRALCRRKKPVGVRNSALMVAFQKPRSAPYVPPIDVPNETWTTNKKLLERYPGVFKTAEEPQH